MKIRKTQTVGGTVAEDYRTAEVFRSFGMDFCCGGGKTIEEACREKGVDIETLAKALEKSMDEPAARQNYNDWSLHFLIDYIINNHHGFVRKKLPEIEYYARKVAGVHGSRHPELVDIHRLFTRLKDEMLDHLEKEEQVLFPYIKNLVNAENGEESTNANPGFRTVEVPINLMEQEHEAAGGIMDEIKTLSNHFRPPEDACATFRVLFKNLQGFQEDLHKHVHLENNILFPKAKELEERLN